MKFDKFYVRGLQRSGTNFTETVLNDNLYNITPLIFPQDAGRMHWKHGYGTTIESLYGEKLAEGIQKHVALSIKPENEWWVNEDGVYFNPFAIYEDVFNVVVSKNPYMWIDSIIRYVADICVRRDLSPDPGDMCYIGGLIGQRGYESAPKNVLLSLRKTIELYNNFHNFWIDMVDQYPNCIVYRYESIVQNPTKFIKFVANKSHTMPHANVTVPEKVDQSKSFKPGDEQKYLKTDYGYVNVYKDAITEFLDHDLMHRLGYELL